MNNPVLKQIADLQNLTMAELRKLWCTLCGTHPPAYNRSYMVKRLAYRIQELAYGGLSEKAHKMMDDILDAHGFDENGGRPGAARRRGRSCKADSPVVGTLLIREWKGMVYEVNVVNGGYEYQGVKYRSLTRIANLITGGHWNGPAFFGLKNDSQRNRIRR